MKKASFLILFITVLLINNTYSQNAIINNNYITVNAGDTATVNMIINNYDPDEGEYFVIKKIEVPDNRFIKYYSKSDSTITFSTYFKINGNFNIICNVNEMRNNFVLKTYKDTLFIKTQNSKWFDTLDINDIKSLYSANGLLFYDGINSHSCFEFPKNSKLHCNFSSSMNFGGYDNNNQIRLSANFDSENGDFSVGSIAIDNNTLNFKNKYQRVWTITKENIDFHILNWNKPEYVIEEVIKNWPANGDTINGEMFLMAPFKDLNNNQVYEPLLGEYPLIKGDMCIFFIYNDKSQAQSYTLGKGLDIEIHAMAYAFNSPNNKAINNTQFVEYSLYNRSNIIYKDFIINIFDDIEIGNPYNDYLGCDTNLNLGFGYNATSYDEDYYQTQGYNNFPPAIGVQFLSHKLNAFVISCNLNIPSTNNNEQEFINLFKGKFIEGNNIYYGGDGIFGHPNVSNQVVNKMYFGNIFDSTQWSEKWNNNPLGNDRKMFMSTPKKDNFAPNEIIKFDIAFIVAQDSSLNNLQNVNLLKQYAQTVKDFHKVIGKEEITKIDNKIKIYPNPTNDKFYIDFGNDNENFDIHIYDLNGKIILSKKAAQNYSSIDVNNLKQGIYFVNFSNNKNTYTTKFIKN